MVNVSWRMQQVLGARTLGRRQDRRRRHDLQHRRHLHRKTSTREKKAKVASPYSITERMVPELIPVLGSQPAGNVNHKPDGRLPLLSARPAVTPATLKRAATNFAVR